MKKPTALILTYHTLFTFRIGGIHKIIDILGRNGYQLDVVTVDYNLYKLIRPDERVSFGMLRRLMKGAEKEYPWGKAVNHVLLNLKLPRQVQKLTGERLYNACLNSTLFMPKLQKRYDLAVVESTLLLGNKGLLKLVERADKVVYRPSDPVLYYAPSAAVIEAEKRMVSRADITMAANRQDIEEYAKAGFDTSRMHLLENEAPFSLPEETENPYTGGMNAFYFGMTKLDYDLIRTAATKNPGITFTIGGPYEDTLHLPNVRFTGPLSPDAASGYIRHADLFIQPFAAYGDLIASLTVTGKVLLFMQRERHIVSYGISPDARQFGLTVAESHEEFARLTGELAGKPAAYPESQLSRSRPGYLENRFKELLKFL